MADKPLSFKDFLTVDYTQTGDGQLAKNAKQRKTEDVEETDEALDFQQRRARGRSMKKNKAKIAMGRKRAAKKTASQEVLQKRARKSAISTLFKKFSKGTPKSDVPASRRQEIEKRIEKMKSKVNMIARKNLPAIRKLEKDRRQGGNDPK